MPAASARMQHQKYSVIAANKVCRCGMRARLISGVRPAQNQRRSHIIFFRCARRDGERNDFVFAPNGASDLTGFGIAIAYTAGARKASLLSMNILQPLFLKSL
jgi:hypothetical protein